MIDYYKNNNKYYDYSNYLRGKLFLRTIFREQYFSQNIAHINTNSCLYEIFNSKLYGYIISTKTLDWLKEVYYNEDKILVKANSLLCGVFHLDNIYEIWDLNINLLINSGQHLVVNDIETKINKLKHPLTKAHM